MHLVLTTVTYNTVNVRERVHNGKTKLHARMLVNVKDTLFVVISGCNFTSILSLSRIKLSPDHVTTRIIANIKFVNTNGVLIHGRGVMNLAATTSV